MSAQMLQRLIWVGLVLVVMLIISLATVFMVFLGLLPTFVAAVVDRAEGKYATFCVLGLNFSGLFPFLMEIWFKDHSFDAAVTIMADPFNLIIIYGAAAFGWMLFIALPPVVTTFLSVMSQHRMTILQENQRNIIEEWGEGITTAIELAESGESFEEGIAPPA
ncbi:MAG: acyl-CoA synthetase [Rhodospirillales bacterium]|nr:acyl-CoA synthetase [Rhodospirillales bacterium]